MERMVKATETGIKSRSARLPWLDGHPPHLPCVASDIAPDVLLPGDPGRVDMVMEQLSNAVLHGQKREFRAATGMTAHGRPVTVCSTGIGGPSTEIATVELSMLGAERAIRIGGMGALLPGMPLGSLLIVESATGHSGTRHVYSPGSSDEHASPDIVAALVQAATILQVPFRVGRICTTDSYYLGQGRPIRLGDETHETDRIDYARAQNIAGFEMETEALFAVGNKIGIQVGAVLAVHGNRVTDQWLEDYEPAQKRLIAVACKALDLLNQTVVPGSEHG